MTPAQTIDRLEAMVRSGSGDQVSVDRADLQRILDALRSHPLAAAVAGEVEVVTMRTSSLPLDERVALENRGRRPPNFDRPYVALVRWGGGEVAAVFTGAYPSVPACQARRWLRQNNANLDRTTWRSEV